MKIIKKICTEDTKALIKIQNKLELPRTNIKKLCIITSLPSDNKIN